MNPEAIRKLIENRPFEPFEVELSSGQRYRVTHPESVMLLKNTLVIGDAEIDGVIWCSLLHIAAIHRKPQSLAG